MSHLKNSIILVSVISLFLIAALYVGVSYYMYDSLSKVTAGGGEHAQNIPSSFM